MFKKMFDRLLRRNKTSKEKPVSVNVQSPTLETQRYRQPAYTRVPTPAPIVDQTAVDNNNFMMTAILINDMIEADNNSKPCKVGATHVSALVSSSCVQDAGSSHSSHGSYSSYDSSSSHSSYDSSSYSSYDSGSSTDSSY